MAASKHTWVVDALESETAQVEVDGNRVARVPVWVLPSGASRGDVLSVLHNREGDVSSLTIAIDGESKKRALNQSTTQASAPVPKGKVGKIVL